jgi:glycosyltransferase involved in cell wall biosynthesis
MQYSIDTSERSFLFANPHLHHSYFTVLSLSRIGRVVLLCPPLQLEFILRRWRLGNLRLTCPSLTVFLCQAISLITFLCFKASIISEYHYIFVLTALVNLITRRHSGLFWVHYQDYIQLSCASRRHIAMDICELIIESDPTQLNWNSTSLSVLNAQAVIVPTSTVLPVDLDSSKIVLIAPYGGNKVSYLSGHKHSHHFPSGSHQRKSHNTFLIAARSNSFRKGIDILTDAVIQLDKLLPKNSSRKVLICICGNVSEPSSILHLHECQARLTSSRSSITVVARQYSQHSYFSLLSIADLFVMPSRLEGSSPAALEALWAGVPCILSSHCGVHKFKNKSHGLQLESNSSDCLASSMKNVLDSPDLVSKWKSALAADQSIFSWDAYLDAYSSFAGFLP